MSRSLALVRAASFPEPDAANPTADFWALGFHYRVERKENRVVHREMKEDGQGQVLAERKAEIDFAVGSGTRGRSYLIDQDGYLFQSPITWYPQKRVWDLSPGYATRHHHFARPVSAECLFCHSNRVESMPDTVNHYRSPIFQGYAIGCERCHGPGELHVRLRERGEEAPQIDFTIVNPRHLEPALRDSVCEQCHLQGEARVVRRGLSTFDYRPGLPLHLFLSVFVRPADANEMKFVGQVEQMHASRCFVSSAGKMGCSTCHDPHHFPSTQERVAYHRDRCLECHEQKPCSLPMTVRVRKSKPDSCIDCHMPAGKSDIPHASVTDHRIVRQVEPQERTEPAPGPRRPLDGRLVHFHRDLVRVDDPEVRRDLGIAQMDRIERYPDSTRRMLGESALLLLEPALRTVDDDVPAWLAKANALWASGRAHDAAEAFDVLLAKSPRHEAALHGAATLAMEQERPDTASDYWERAIRVNPWRYEFHYGLAAARAHRGNWTAAREECRQALRLNPFHGEVRKLLVRCCLAMGAKDEARSEFELLLALQPGQAEVLRKWYAERQQ
jgi:Tfp pilus assembly protein PilF